MSERPTSPYPRPGAKPDTSARDRIALVLLVVLAAPILLVVGILLIIGD